MELLDYRRKYELYKNQTGPIRRGVGMAVFWYNTAVWPISLESSSCRMVVNQDGSLQFQTGETEIGQGCDTAYSQMVADAVGVPLSDVHVVSSQDTDVTPYGTGAYASRQTYTCAPAVHAAADELRRKILGYAAEMTGHTPAALTIAPTAQGDAVAFARNPESVVVTLHDLAMDSFYNKDPPPSAAALPKWKWTSNCARSASCTS